MSEVLFYHLERTPLEELLPGLLEKTRERGWRAVVRVGSDERAAALDSQLWTYRDDAFLPHGLERDAHPAEQPIILTTHEGNPNGAQVMFLADGAELSDWTTPDIAQLTRLVLVFDGRDPAALEAARAQWKTAKAAGHDVTYWQQSAAGKWEKKA